MVSLHPVIPQVQRLRRPNDQDKPVVGQGGHSAFKGGLRVAATAVSRLQAHPPPPVAHRGRRERANLEPLRGPDRVASLRLFMSHQHASPPGVQSIASARILWPLTAARRGTPWAESMDPPSPLL